MVYKRKIEERGLFYSFMEISGTKVRFFDATQPKPYWRDPVFSIDVILKEYEETDLTFEEALLIDML